MSITATNHDSQLCEIYSMMLNQLNCTFAVSFSRFHCCGHHGPRLWPSWFVAITVVAIMVKAHIYGMTIKQQQQQQSE